MIMQPTLISGAIASTTTTSAEFINFCNSWLSSTSTTLTHLIVRGSMMDLEEYKMTRDFMPWNPLNRSAYFYVPSDSVKVWDCSEATDIKRDDGLLASIYQKNDVVALFIWHKRFPTLEPPASEDEGN